MHCPSVAMGNEVQTQPTPGSNRIPGHYKRGYLIPSTAPSAGRHVYTAFYLIQKAHHCFAQINTHIN